MLDPFPLPAIAVLRDLGQWLGRMVGLETLGLHIHEILYAFVFYDFVFNHFSPVLSIRFAGNHYVALSHDGQLRWRMKCVSFVQSIFISIASLCILYCDDERAKMSLEERIWGYTGAAGMVQGLAVGYFVWDTYIMARHLSVFGTAMLAHGLAASITYTLGFRPVFNYYGCTFMLYELSTPLLNIHWFLDKFQMAGSKLQLYNGVALIVTFFCVRLLYGGYMSLRLYFDVWRALQLDCSRLQPMFRSTAASKVTSVALSSSCSLPWWVLLIYLGGHVTLTSLNIFWFRAMIRAVNRRAAIRRS